MVYVGEFRTNLVVIPRFFKILSYKKWILGGWGSNDYLYRFLYSISMYKLYIEYTEYSTDGCIHSVHAINAMFVDTCVYYVKHTPSPDFFGVGGGASEHF